MTMAKRASTGSRAFSASGAIPRASKARRMSTGCETFVVFNRNTASRRKQAVPTRSSD